MEEAHEADQEKSAGPETDPVEPVEQEGPESSDRIEPGDEVSIPTDDPQQDLEETVDGETLTPTAELATEVSTDPVPVETVAAGPDPETSNLTRRSYFIFFSALLIVGLVIVAYFQFLNGPVPGTSATRGFETTATGLQYQDQVQGSGEEVVSGSSVSVHYILFLEDGTEVDSSRARGTPFTFTVGQGQVIPGWEEGLLGMRVGGSRTLVIPPSLAYGEQGAGGVIPPNATLRFEVEVLAIHAVEVEKLVDGSGPPVASGDRVTLEYTGWLEDGTQFDSSSSSGPIIFTVDAGEIIPGLNQGVIGMQVGEKRLLTVPPELAFGDQAVGTVIPPNATLVVEVELVSIE